MQALISIQTMSSRSVARVVGLDEMKDLAKLSDKEIFLCDNEYLKLHKYLLFTKLYNNFFHQKSYLLLLINNSSNNSNNLSGRHPVVPGF